MTSWLPGEGIRRYRCRRVARLIQSYLDGMIADRVSAHLEECRRCGLEAATYAEIKNALARHSQAPPEAVERLRSFGRGLIDQE